MRQKEPPGTENPFFFTHSMLKALHVEPYFKGQIRRLQAPKPGVSGPTPCWKTRPKSFFEVFYLLVLVGLMALSLHFLLMPALEASKFKVQGLGLRVVQLEADSCRTHGRPDRKEGNGGW